MANWYKIPHNLPYNVIWKLVADTAHVKTDKVFCVFLSLLDYASQQENKGSIAGFDERVCQIAFGYSPKKVKSIIDAMLKEGVITSNLRIAHWELFEPDEPQAVISWRQKNAARAARRRALMDVSPSEWDKLRQQVFRRDGYVCQYCGKRVEHPHCDHVFPLSKGGRSTLDNLVTACPTCNFSKCDKMPDEWRK